MGLNAMRWYERSREWARHQPALAAGYAALILLGVVGSAIGGVRAVTDLFSHEERRPTTVVTVPSRLIARDGNPRFGFWFSYPQTWDRTDSPNGDGNVFNPPDDAGVELRVWGANLANLPVVGGQPDSLPALVQRNRDSIRSAGGAVLESRPYGLHREGEVDGHASSEQISGWRLRFRRPGEGAQPASTALWVFTVLDGRQADIQCQAPTSRYPAYEDLCNELVSTLRLTALEAPVPSTSERSGESGPR